MVSTPLLQAFALGSLLLTSSVSYSQDQIPAEVKVTDGTIRGTLYRPPKGSQLQPGILAVPDLYGSSTDFELIAKALSKGTKGFFVLAIDLFSHGKSDEVSASIKEMKKDPEAERIFLRLQKKILPEVYQEFMGRSVDGTDRLHTTRVSLMTMGRLSVIGSWMTSELEVFSWIALSPTLKDEILGGRYYEDHWIDIASHGGKYMVFSQSKKEEKAFTDFLSEIVTGFDVEESEGHFLRYSSKDGKPWISGSGIKAIKDMIRPPKDKKSSKKRQR